MTDKQETYNITCDLDIAIKLKWALIQAAEKNATVAYGIDVFVSVSRDDLIKQANRYYQLAHELATLIEDENPGENRIELMYD